MPTRTPRTGRRPGDSGSREAVLAAARRLFAQHGFSDTPMRAIAAEAGVDAALSVHFFGTKAKLLTAAVRPQSGCGAASSRGTGCQAGDHARVTRAG